MLVSVYLVDAGLGYGWTESCADLGVEAAECVRCWYEAVEVVEGAWSVVDVDAE